jgi:hypothetical protein
MVDIFNAIDGTIKDKKIHTPTTYLHTTDSTVYPLDISVRGGFSAQLVDIPVSLYSLIGDFFIIWRLMNDFKSEIVFSADFDYDLDTYYI